jgi:hypothetical protein
MKVAELWQRVLDSVRPYTFEDYVREYGPRDHKELEDLERKWSQSGGWFNKSQ